MTLSLTTRTLCSFLLVTGLVACGATSEDSNTSDASSPDTDIAEGSDSTAPGTDTPAEQASGEDLTVLFSITPASITTDGFARFAFSAPDAASYECSVDLGSYSACQSPLFLTDFNQGSHRLDVMALSADGTPGEVGSHTWTVDSVFNPLHADLIPTNQSPDPVAANSWRGILRINCDFSHSSYNDPIVYPGQENAAHLHRFYGNMLVDHNTTNESLLTDGDSSCQGGELNRSAYWVPALLAPLYDQVTGARQLDEQGEPAWQVVPAVVGNDDEAHEIFYYSAGVDDLSSIQPVPPGLRMIAGTATTQPGQEQDSAIVRWHCQSWESDDATNPQFSASIPECVAPDRVRMDVFFPSCWNGTDLDSADHKSHMAYPVNTGGLNGTQCPESHPIPVVRPSYHYAFGVKPEVYDPVTKTSKGWRLASDMYEVSDSTPGGLSLHADWINGWHPEIMALLLESCIQAGLDCHDGNLANGYRLSGTQPGSQVEPMIMNQGMGAGMQM